MSMFGQPFKEWVLLAADCRMLASSWWGQCVIRSVTHRPSISWLDGYMDASAGCVSVTRSGIHLEGSWDTLVHICQLAAEAAQHSDRIIPVHMTSSHPHG
jgi:hypothetical protein